MNKYEQIHQFTILSDESMLISIFVDDGNELVKVHAAGLVHVKRREELLAAVRIDAEPQNNLHRDSSSVSMNCSFVINQRYQLFGP